MKIVDDKEEALIKQTDSFAITPREILQEALNELDDPESDYYNSKRMIICYEREDSGASYSACNCSSSHAVSLLEKIKFMILNSWIRK